jgi:mono/diheme cytochrome c family protein/ketosteroid isomerase-like protein
MKTVKIAGLILVAVVLFAAVGVYSGVFNVAADDPHWGITVRVMETARERSIASHAKAITAPANLDDAKLIASGAGEYAEMCVGCHLAPGMKDTEMRAGLYPQPPDLTSRGTQRSAAQQFWIVKHGLKMTGMPAWGLTHDDERIWSMVAFLQKLPELTPASYQALIASGEGGHHHDEAEGGEHHHDAAAATSPASAALPAPAAGAAAAVDRFQQLLAQGDTKGAAELLDAMVLIYEGGGAEKSREEYASHHLSADAKFLKGAKVRVLSRSGNAVGDLAWVATESEITTAGSAPTKLLTTETMVLKRDASGWRVAHIHWSSQKKG